MDSVAWYAVHVRSNQERVAADHIRAAGVEAFLPTYRSPSSRTDRKVILDRPLFSGYLFVRLSEQQPQRVDVLRAPGVVRIVGFGGAAVSVSDETIKSLKILVGEATHQARPHPLVQAGRKVVVMDGPFTGAIGTIHDSADRKHRLVVEVKFLGRAVAVPIEPDQVKLLFD